MLFGASGASVILLTSPHFLRQCWTRARAARVWGHEREGAGGRVVFFSGTEVGCTEHRLTR